MWDIYIYNVLDKSGKNGEGKMWKNSNFILEM